MIGARCSVCPGAWNGGKFEDFTTEVSEGMVVLDAVRDIQSSQANDLACRWNCKAGKCGSCSTEINGMPKLMCMTRLNSLPLDAAPTSKPTTVGSSQRAAQKLCCFMVAQVPMPTASCGKRWTVLRRRRPSARPATMTRSLTGMPAPASSCAITSRHANWRMWRCNRSGRGTDVWRIGGSFSSLRRNGAVPDVIWNSCAQDHSNLQHVCCRRRSRR